MNLQHFQAFLWLRWRLRVNQLKRGGIFNAIILIILAVAGVIASIVLFFAFLFVGIFALSDVPPAVLMYVWDGLVVAFLFLWIAGLLTDLQRYEALSLQKLLHLPVSLTNAFLINYLSSLSSIILVLFVPSMLGLCLGLLVSRGWAMLLLLPLLAALLLTVTALTYQFQGWLAALMSNPRRRRTVIATVTIAFVLIFQLPQLLNIFVQRSLHQKANGLAPPPVPVAKQKGVNEGDIDLIKQHQLEEIHRQIENPNRGAERQTAQQVEEMATLLNAVLPPCWLPLGAMSLARANVWPALLGTLGLTLIGTASLWRAYRTTLRLYRGEYTSSQAASVSRPVEDRTSRPAPAARRKTGLLERKLPWLSEQAAVIALAAFRSLLRAPEGKMILLTPLLLLAIFGSMYFTGAYSGNRSNFPQEARPLIDFGFMALVMFTMTQLIGNQFGFDRNGFRVYVLSPARRRDILLGKNLATAPIALTIGAVASLFLQVAFPMSLYHFLALAPRFVSMYFLYCLPANALSILSPMRIASGSLQPTRPGGLAFLWQFIFLFVCPPILGLALVPLGIDLLVEKMGWLPGAPLDLVLSLLECAAIVFMYRLVVDLEGDWLQAREQRILEIVTTRTE